MDAALSRVALQAALDGNLLLLKEVAKKVDLRGIRATGGRNVLHAASAKGHLDICQFLIEEGPRLDVNSRSTQGHTPVLLAAFAGNLPVLSYLLDHGGDPAMPDARGLTPLHEAATNGLLHLSSSSSLIGLIQISFCGLISCLPQGHCDVVKLLLSKGVPVEPLANMWTPLDFAVSKGHHQVLSILLDRGADAGADVNFTTPYGQTAFTNTITACLPDVAKLKEVAADPNYRGEEVTWGPRKLVEILFSWTKPIPSLPDWNVDAIIRTLKLKTKVAVSVELVERLCNWKLKGKEAFGKGDCLAATYFYGLAIGIDPLDATLFANRSVSFLRMGEGQSALADAQRCRMMCPRWAKAWYRQGAAFRLLKSYKEAAHAIVEALKLDSSSDEIRNALRQTLSIPSIRTFNYLLTLSTLFLGL
ncbi:hypothetical protein EJB05_01986, partial [Eragrostis curvula]